MYARCEDQPRFSNEDIIALGILQFYIICWLTNEYSKTKSLLFILMNEKACMILCTLKMN